MGELILAIITLMSKSFYSVIYNELATAFKAQNEGLSYKLQSFKIQLLASERSNSSIDLYQSS